MYPDEEDRRRWQDPEEILSNIGLQSGSTFVDLGCGRGFFAIPAAKIVGEDGKVYGVDRNPDFLKELDRKATEEGLANIHSILGKAEDTILCKRCADIVFFGIVLHDFDDPAKVLRNAMRMLRSTGRLINLDWKKEHIDFGPPYERRFNEHQAKDIIEEAGFIVESVKDSGFYHYLITARKR